MLEDLSLGKLILLLAFLAIYFLPTWLAAAGKKPNLTPIFLLNLFLGWTIIGWIVGMILAVRKESTLASTISTTENVGQETKGKTTKKPSALSRVVWLLLALGVVLVALNWQSLYRAFAPPNPVVVDKGGDDLSSKLFDYSLRVWADVRNDGGDGVVAMEATIIQGNKTYTQTTTQYFKSLQTSRMQIVFEEPTFLGSLFGGAWKYQVRVFAYGK